jgi:hypothetical protein
MAMLRYMFGEATGVDAPCYPRTACSVVAVQHYMHGTVHGTERCAETQFYSFTATLPACLLRYIPVLYRLRLIFIHTAAYSLMPPVFTRFLECQYRHARAVHRVCACVCLPQLTLLLLAAACCCLPAAAADAAAACCRLLLPAAHAACCCLLLTLVLTLLLPAAACCCPQSTHFSHPCPYSLS